MNNIEAMKLALDALKDAEKYGKVYFPGAIAALRQAISEAEQAEPDVKLKKAAEIYTEDYEAGKHDAEQAEQEPVAWIDNETWCFTYSQYEYEQLDEDLKDDLVPLFTAPPQREWVSLTDDEIFNCFNGRNGVCVDIARAIEAKLKEKNCD